MTQPASFLIGLFTKIYKSSFIWKAKVPNKANKVKAFVWIAILEKVNTLDNLQVPRPNGALSPSVGIMSSDPHVLALSSCCSFMETAFWF